MRVVFYFILLIMFMSFVSVVFVANDIHKAPEDICSNWEADTAITHSLALFRLPSIPSFVNLPQGKQHQIQKTLEEWRLMIRVSLSIFNHAKCLKERKSEHLFPYHNFW